MAKAGFGGLALGAALVVALLAAGHPGTRADGDPPADPAGTSADPAAAGADPPAGSRSGADTASHALAPPAPPVPGQREKDQGPPPVGLVPDPVTDECVLTAAEVQALIGQPVDRTAMTSLPSTDGKSVRGCVAFRGENQLVLMNVYGTRDGTPADAVRNGSGTRRALDGVGEAAAVVDSKVGPTLQVAGKKFLVTIEAGFLTPSDDAWRAAGRAAVDRAG
jgi:hypothetical protein